MADDKRSVSDPEATGPDDYDSAWKHMVDRFLPQFLQLLHPKAYADIDWERAVVSLDKDLKKLVPKAKASSRWADKLLKFWRRGLPTEGSKDFVGIEPGIVYLHAEFQSHRDQDLPERMFVTSYRVFDRYRCPVVGLVVLGQKADLEPSFGWRLWDGWFGIGFPVIKLWEYNEPERWAELEALAETNPFAILVMAHLKTVETKDRASRRYTWKRRLFRRLLESSYERHDIEALLNFVDWLMRLPEPLEERLDKEVEEMEATKRVPYMTPWERRGIKKGLEKGVRLGKAEALKSQATQRFGELPADVVERLGRADVETLDRWLCKLLDAQRLEDLFDAGQDS